MNTYALYTAARRRRLRTRHYERTIVGVACGVALVVVIFTLTFALMTLGQGA